MTRARSDLPQSASNRPAVYIPFVLNSLEDSLTEGSIVVNSLLWESKRGGRRLKSHSQETHQRLDIQGLRMVAVMLVVLSHLFHWPRGGFIGVDVFFVISGFLITGSLLHTLEQTGRISFSNFYRRRIRRILPAATLVLFATYVAAQAVYTTGRFQSTLLDAVSGFFFVANWRYGLEGTDYFNASGPVSPLQHYWSLSVEEQFYFVWPAIIFVVGLVAVRKSRRVLAAVVMGAVVAASFAYSIIGTASNPTWAYFSTLTRVWELGVGALLAITIRHCERIPDALRPFLAWLGLAMIGVGAFAITETAGGFPAPWALVPVMGAAFFIAAGVSGNHRFLSIFTNRVSRYIGDISYSLYLWHWPIIVLLASLMDRSAYYFATALFLMSGLSIAAYHLIENPVRASKWLETSSETKDRRILDRSRWRLPTLKMSEANQSIGIGALALATAGLVVFALAPVAPPSASSLISAGMPSVVEASQGGPAQEALSREIRAAALAAAWPDLSPSMDEVSARVRSGVSDTVGACTGLTPPQIDQCTFGDPSAERTIAVLGDSTAMTYVETFKWIADHSSGSWKVEVLAMSGCPFADGEFVAPNAALQSACPGRVSRGIEHVKTTRPDLVVIANNYAPRKLVSSKSDITVHERRLSEEAAVRQVAESSGKVVMLAPAPQGEDVRQCFTKQSTPSDCLTTVDALWLDVLAMESEMSQSNHWLHINTLPMFCTTSQYCPSFIGSTPVKVDQVHLTSEYAVAMAPALMEKLQSVGAL
ncbi:acyltransferase family protein [Rhodococcus wratislaviensis]|uniref:acyltransferase family protein n=1 Tax=Rhodococcus wratislaviensis TaxID=44752 RepID=UPI003651D91E